MAVFRRLCSFRTVAVACLFCLYLVGILYCNNALQWHYNRKEAVHRTQILHHEHVKNPGRNLIPNMSKRHFKQPLLQRCRRQDGRVKSNNSYIKHTSIIYTEIVKDDMYVYSAFFDDREVTTYIRLIAVGRKRAVYHNSSHQVDLWCHFPTSKKVREHTDVFYKSTNVNFHEMTGKREVDTFGGFILSCAVPHDVDAPCSIYVSQGKDWRLSESLTSIPVNSVKNSGYKSNLAICVPPLYDQVNAKRLVEYLELTRRLGADTVFIYLHTNDRDTFKLLAYYELKHKFVAIIPWELPTPNDFMIWSNGRNVAMNDCLYRAMSTFRFTAFNNFNEFIVPTENIGIVEILQGMNTADHASYTFEKAYFHVPPLSDFVVTSMNRAIQTSLVDRNVVVETLKVFEIGRYYNIQSWPVSKNFSNYHIQKDIAVVNKYGACTSAGGMNCAEHKKDPILFERYGYQVVETVNRLFSKH